MDGVQRLTAATRFHGVFPIVPTIFDDDGSLDERGQRATVDALLEGGVHGLVVLANASEGYAVRESERDLVIRWVIDQTAGRIPVVVTCNHPSTRVAVHYAQAAEGMGAAAIMFLPPFFGQWASDAAGIVRHSEALSAATSLPLILQDHPLSGIPLPTALLADLARRVERLEYFKVEAANAPAKIAQILKLAPGRVSGIFGGIAGIVFLDELDQGAVGTMPSSAIPDVFVQILDHYASGDRPAAAALFARYLPLIVFETHLAGHRMAKEILLARGVIRSAALRGPIRSTWDEGTVRTFRILLDELVRAADSRA